jgi:hypothetical protein
MRLLPQRRSNTALLASVWMEIRPSANDQIIEENQVEENQVEACVWRNLD